MPEWQRDTALAGPEDKMADMHEPKDPEPEKTPCTRCGAPAEHEGDLLRRKREDGIH
jgi:hypothetical protein